MTVNEYISNLPNTEIFLALTDEQKERWIFQAEEVLNDHFKPHQITTRAVALQTIYMFEGESEDFAMLRRQGISSFQTEGISVSFGGGQISPMVLDVIRRGSGAKVGRLI